MPSSKHNQLKLVVDVHGLQVCVQPFSDLPVVESLRLDAIHHAHTLCPIHLKRRKQKPKEEEERERKRTRESEMNV